MTVTEIRPNANLPTSSGTESSWGKGSCWRTDTRIDRGRSYQVSTCCKQLDCEECGPKKRQADYDGAVLRFAAEEKIWAVFVPAKMVDRLRKQAARVGQPIESVPVAKDWNVLFSPHRFENAYELSSEDVRRVFLIDRISKRQHTRNGRWEDKKKAQKPASGETISRGFIGSEAFANVATTHGLKVFQSGTGRYFDDPLERGSDYWKPLFVKEEHELRRKRRLARGWKVWGGHMIRVRAA